MFHNSTTIWHNPVSEKTFSKEKRIIFGFWGAVFSIPSAMWGATKKTASLGGKFVKLNVKAGSWLMTAPFTLVGVDKLLAKGYEASKKGVHYSEWGARVAKEGAMGLGYNAIGKSVGELAISPLRYAKRLFVDNTRDVFKDILTLKTPKNIIKSPLYFGQGIKRGVMESREHYKDIIKNVVGFKPFSAINSTRKALFSTLAIPFKGIWDPTRKVLDTPIQMGKNVLNAQWAYPQAIWKGPQYWKEGIERLKNAPATATKEMEDANRTHMLDVLKSKREKYGERFKKGSEWAGGKWRNFTGDAAPTPTPGSAPGPTPTPAPAPSTP